MREEYKEYDHPKEMSDYYSEWSKDINNNKDHRILAIENYCGFIHEFGYNIYESILECDMLNINK